MTTLTWMNELKADAIAEGLAEGRQEGREKGRSEEAERYSAMTIRSLEQKRYDDLEKAARDCVFREAIYRELGID